MYPLPSICLPICPANHHLSTFTLVPTNPAVYLSLRSLSTVHLPIYPFIHYHPSICYPSTYPPTVYPIHPLIHCTFAHLLIHPSIHPLFNHVPTYLQSIHLPTIHPLIYPSKYSPSYPSIILLPTCSPIYQPLLHPPPFIFPGLSTHIPIHLPIFSSCSSLHS